MEKMKNISLKPDFKLLNPDFDGYKLSNDADITVYTRTLESNEGLEKRQKNSNCYLHTRLEALHNHLFADPFNLSYVYYFSGKGHLVKHYYSKDARLNAGEVVWQAELTRPFEENTDDESARHYYASVMFPTADLAVVSNGQGTLHVLETGDRSTTHSWLECYEGNTDSGTLLQARLIEGSAHERYLHCMVMSVVSIQDLISNDKYQIVDEKLKSSTGTAAHLISWIIMTYNGATWEMSRTRYIAGEGSIEYCSLDENLSGVVLLCHKNYSYIWDSQVPVTIPEVQITDEEKSAPKFTYLQSSEDVSMWINIGTATKKDLEVKVTVQDLKISIQGNQVLSGRFSHPVHADSTTWTINDGKLEIVFPKATEELHWTSFFQEGDPKGDELLDPQMVEEVNKRLAHLTSDKIDANPDLDKPAYNPGQFEACDEASEDLILLRLDGSTHRISCMAQLGPTQHLFNNVVQGNSVPAFCIRHDVDGVLWQLESEERFTHSATFNAFGYVKASKTMAKFTCAAPDNSFVAVADVKSHIYVFFQPEGISGELRNRKSGKRVNTVARQVVISMKSHDEILGLQASFNTLFVLTDKNMFAYCLRQ